MSNDPERVRTEYADEKRYAARMAKQETALVPTRMTWSLPRSPKCSHGTCWRSGADEGNLRSGCRTSSHRTSSLSISPRAWSSSQLLAESRQSSATLWTCRFAMDVSTARWQRGCSTTRPTSIGP